MALLLKMKNVNERTSAPVAIRKFATKLGLVRMK